MTKFYGAVGFSEVKETSPGIWVESIAERNYRGDILKNVHKWQETNKINDLLSISNRISIVADPYAFENFFSIKFVEWMGAKWKVSNIEVQRPRLILSLGGTYNGDGTE